MEARQDFLEAQQRMLDRFGVKTQSRFVEVSSVFGQAHALVAGEGPPVVMIGGIGTPGAMWAPLMAELDGFRLFAIDLPAHGLTDTTRLFARNLRGNAVGFLEEVLDGLGLDQPAFVASSLGSLWVSWLALDRGKRVAALAHLGCPALALDTSAPFPFPSLGYSARRLGVNGGASEIEHHARLITCYPSIVSWRNDADIAGAHLSGGAVVHPHDQSSRNDIAEVMNLTAIGFHYRLDGFRPAPARLKDRAHYLDFSQIHDLDFALGDGACFIRSIKTLLG